MTATTLALSGALTVSSLRSFGGLTGTFLASSGPLTATSLVFTSLSASGTLTADIFAGRALSVTAGVTAAAIECAGGVTVGSSLFAQSLSAIGGITAAGWITTAGPFTAAALTAPAVQAGSITAVTTVDVGMITVSAASSGSALVEAVATCGAGQRVIGGGCRTDLASAGWLNNAPDATNAWRCSLDAGASTAQLTAVGVCARVT
jgi:hypothetical protein